MPKFYVKTKKLSTFQSNQEYLGTKRGRLIQFVYTPENFDDIVGLEVNGVIFQVIGD